MRDLARYEIRRRLRGTAAMGAGIAVLTALYLWLFPSVATSGVDLERYIEAFPPAVRELFGIRALGTIEGFLAAELYGFLWVLVLGPYLAYSAAGLIAGAVESGRLDLLLALPLRRSEVFLGEASALVVPIIVVNVTTPAVIVGGVFAIGETIDTTALIAVHALSVPYLLACASVGLIASVVAARSAVAERVAAGVIVGSILVESVVVGTDLAVLGVIAPSHYYHPTDVLVDHQFDLRGAAILLAAAVLGVGLALAVFTRRDIQ